MLNTKSRLPRTALVGSLSIVIAAIAGCNPTTPAPTPPSGEAHLADSEGSLYTVYRGDRRFAVYLPGFWTAASMSSTNARTNTWTTHVVLSADGYPDVTILSKSENPSLITINNTQLDLTRGAFFHLLNVDTPQQLPFAPLAYSDGNDLDRLNEFFAQSSDN